MQKQQLKKTKRKRKKTADVASCIMKKLVFTAETQSFGLALRLGVRVGARVI
jgi:hypothetical protein